MKLRIQVNVHHSTQMWVTSLTCELGVFDTEQTGKCLNIRLPSALCVFPFNTKLHRYLFLLRLFGVKHSLNRLRMLYFKFFQKSPIDRSLRFVQQKSTWVKNTTLKYVFPLSNFQRNNNSSLKDFSIILKIIYMHFR